jgi:superfamily I DNA/RNA helicase
MIHVCLRALNKYLPLGEFVDITSRFRGSTEQFYETLSSPLGRVREGLYHAEAGDGDAVNILTYFRAKGRQWSSIIIPSANQKIIPLPSSPIEDERRLFYVAVSASGNAP